MSLALPAAGSAGSARCKRRQVCSQFLNQHICYDTCPSSNAPLHDYEPQFYHNSGSRSLHSFHNMGRVVSKQSLLRLEASLGEGGLHSIVGTAISTVITETFQWVSEAQPTPLTLIATLEPCRVGASMPWAMMVSGGSLPLAICQHGFSAAWLAFQSNVLLALFYLRLTKYL